MKVVLLRDLTTLQIGFHPVLHWIILLLKDKGLQMLLHQELSLDAQVTAESGSAFYKTEAFVGN